MRKAGRPIKKVANGERTQIGVIIGGNTKARLLKAMKESGRTISREAEHLIERAFIFEDLLKGNSYVITKFEVAKLELHEGDILVARTDHLLSKDKASELRGMITQSVPMGVKVMVLTGGLSLAVMQDKRAA